MVVERRWLRSLRKVCSPISFEVRIGLHVTGEAHLQRDTAVGDVLAEPLHVVRAILDLGRADGVGLEQVGAVADAVGVQVGDRLEDALGAVGLAGMDRLLEEVAVRVVEGLAVILGGVARLLACEVEADHLQAVLVTRQDRGARQLHRRHRVQLLRPRVGVGGEQRGVVARERGGELAHRAADDPILEGRLEAVDDLLAAVVAVARPAQPAVDGGEHAHRVQLGVHVKLRREADLEVAHALLLVVLGQLVRDALQRLLVLHHRAGVGEAAQVLGEAGVAVLEHLLAHAALGVRGQRHLLFARQLQQRRQPQRAVEVDVEIGLGELVDEGLGDLGHRSLRNSAGSDCRIVRVRLRRGHGDE